MQNRHFAHGGIHVSNTSSATQASMLDVTSQYPRQPPPYQTSSRSLLSATDRQTMPPFYPSHDMGSISPSDHSPHLGDPFRTSGSGGGSGGGSGAPSPAQMSMMIQNPKRAYRQRRKDPSCDACRERKVKCDATETSSCTECSSRNVRCQFTKDTNRRMSSIKQVQDLERQLHETRQQLEKIRATEQKNESYSDVQSNSPSQIFNDLPSVGKSPRRMLKARSPQDLGHARGLLNDLGRGLLKPPVTASQARSSQHTHPVEMPTLPPRVVADHYLQYYYECVHRKYPVLHWPTFQQNYESVIDHGSMNTMSIYWTSMLLTVLACGALYSNDSNKLHDAQDYLTRAITSINFWEDDLDMNQAITAFLASLFLAELNRRSASWIWAASAVRIAQDLGLHVQGGQWTPIEGEMRKRVWYSLYTWDRLLALELGKPMLINDEDCDTEYPEILDDERMSNEESYHTMPPALLLATIHVSRLLPSLAKLFRSLCITNETLAKYESRLGECLQFMPKPLQFSSTAPIDPCVLGPLIHFQNTRLLLHRHNLSPSCSPEQRSQAIEHCFNASNDTARILSRCINPQVPPSEWEGRFVMAASTLLCTHLWRCLLFLLFRPLDDAFFLLLRGSSIIDATKPINVSCGRYLAFCLHRIIERFEQNVNIDLDQDEEIVVYLSGDLQSSTNSWVWGNAETGTHLSRRQKHGRPKQMSMEHGSLSPPSQPSPSWATSLTEDEQRDWGGWKRVEQYARYLQQLQEKRTQQLHDRGGSHFAGYPHQSKEQDRSSGVTLAPISPSSQQTNSDRSRMTIANII